MTDRGLKIDPDAITLEEHGGRGRYVYRVNGMEAEMTFAITASGDMVIDHTGVPRPLEGQGIAAALVLRGVADARAAGRKIVPLCSYVAAQFRRHPEWSDLLRA